MNGYRHQLMWWHMQVGDLVRWTNPGFEDTGIVLRSDDNLQMYIDWFRCPEHSGPYVVQHEYLEVINESR